MKNLKLWQKMTAGFGLVILLMSIGGYVSFNTAAHLSEITEKLYLHPLAVGTSIRDIQTNLVAIHRSMKDIAISQSLEQIEEHRARVDKNAEETSQYFRLLNERFLSTGNPFGKRSFTCDWLRSPPTRRKLQSGKVPLIWQN